MRLSNVLRSLGSGAALYLVMAACSASDSVLSAGNGGGAGGTGGDGGLGATVDAFADALTDALWSPVNDANAETLPPDVATVPCNTSGTYAGQGSYFAVKAYPGKTKADLSALRMTAHHANTNTRPTVGAEVYEDQLGAFAFVRDGVAAAYCGASSAPTYDSVTFVMPR